MYLGIDLGTSEVKALVIDENHEVIASHSAPLSIQRPHPHWSEQAPELWWEATEYLMATLREKCAQHWPAIKAIGLSGQMHGAVLLDAEGKAIRPAILWNDTRCAAECAELEAMAPELHQVAGNLAMPGFTAPKLLWVRRHEPEHFQRTATVLLPKDYLRYRMTGKKVSDMSDAAGTLWLALAFCLTGGVIALVSLRHIQTPQHMQNLTTREKFSELGRAATLLYTNRNILLSSMVRIINTLSLFGFAVIMPMMFVDELGFSTSEWLQVWAVFFFTTIFSNVLWGILGEKLGWMKVVRWFGCIGMALSSLAFYYIPQHFGHSFAMALIPAIALGIFVAAFVPLAAVFPALEPKHKGAAISVYNLSAGMSNFLAPAIAVVLLPFFSTIGVVIAYTALYVVAFFLCAFIRVEQPGFSHKEATAREQVEFS
ncbi:TPA: MFS transporter [Klebsiella pneumoniae]